MLKYLKKFFSAIHRSTGTEESIHDNNIEFAVAILLVEVMHADHQLDEQEQTMIVTLLQQQFSLNIAEAMGLFEKANQKMKDAISLHQYTSQINSILSYQDKQALMINLWRVVFSDGQVDRYEEHLIRRVADLIYISHKDFVKARHIAEETP